MVSLMGQPVTGPKGANWQACPSQEKGSAWLSCQWKGPVNPDDTGSSRVKWLCRDKLHQRRPTRILFAVSKEEDTPSLQAQVEADLDFFALTTLSLCGEKVQMTGPLVPEDPQRGT